MTSRGWNTADHSDWGCDICGRDAAKRGVTRRGFMKGGALALIGTSSIPAFLSRSVLAEVTTAAANKKKLVVLFQRGAVDGLLGRGRTARSGPGVNPQRGKYRCSYRSHPRNVGKRRGTYLARGSGQALCRNLSGA